MTEECWLCLRTTPQKILEGCHRLYKDAEVAHKIGVKAAELLRDAYLKEPTKVSGRSSKSLMAATVYITGILEENPCSQWELGYAFDVTETALRNNYQYLTKILGINLEEFLEKRESAWKIVASRRWMKRRRWESVEEWIKRVVKCCACKRSLQDSRHVNVVCLNKLATWQYPRWGNVLVMDKYPTNRASAILCDRCIRKQRTAKYAIEWDERTYVKYHRVEDLKDLPTIPEREVLEAEARLYDFGVGST